MLHDELVMDDGDGRGHGYDVDGGHDGDGMNDIADVNTKEFGVRCKITSDKDLLAAAKLLHQFGSLMYFSDKKFGLNDVVIIDSQWLANVFSSVITTKHSFGKKDGIINHTGI